VKLGEGLSLERVELEVGVEELDGVVLLLVQHVPVLDALQGDLQLLVNLFDDQFARHRVLEVEVVQVVQDRLLGLQQLLRLQIYVEVFLAEDLLLDGFEG